MKILAFDTALNACSVAIMDNHDVLAHGHEKRRRGHAETLIPMIEDLMNGAGFSYADMDLIAVTVGPGTFTGLRIGLAAARGMSLAARKPLVGVTTLEALAATVPKEMAEDRPVIATADARRGEIYLQSFKVNTSNGVISPLSPPKACKIGTALASTGLEKAVIVGSGGILLSGQSGFDKTRYQLLELDEDPDAIHVARIALGRGMPPPNSSPPAPLYLRAPDAKLPGGRSPVISP
ncbi:MAG: tRNA (adenosine(37)-N6)-threonylcarbamoyltransferase complex dimerization subunit type 1 TsaB [Sneathiella sp.]|uniref:tRNA (adenosine(37)-N6)-threonylcarbamoyltransferase complex dimerization subunit type 1 TsaB n=1 Tax=Sneathiella sp. TaxID=1964365 RepID=UPI000C5E4CB7|nr:tRNA (adenosine(37)-N6)-threonylcarbamoyltransferase complex dimerization subunit type 1 TsaB [Sneathiella sp.]MAZ04031.1 tRNA (adenosine(37)-N6)-threonylcarbamoyltransferase complex dimerization subunit type 1 TsaB [Sneathiella sp.]